MRTPTDAELQTLALLVMKANTEAELQTLLRIWGRVFTPAKGRR